MKGYIKESDALLNEFYKRELEIIKKYKGIVFSQLDGSPRSLEIDKNFKWCKEVLKKLKKKYNIDTK